MSESHKLIILTASINFHCSGLTTEHPLLFQSDVTAPWFVDVEGTSFTAEVVLIFVKGQPHDEARFYHFVNLLKFHLPV